MGILSQVRPSRIFLIVITATIIAATGASFNLNQSSKLLENSESAILLAVGGSHNLPHNIPDFSQDNSRRTIISKSSGLWTNPSTWGGIVPTLSDVAIVESGHNIEINSTNSEAYTLSIKGKVFFNPSANTRLRAANVVVMEKGTLQIGTESNPVKPDVIAELVIIDAPLNTSSENSSVFDPEQFGTGLIGFGKVEIYGNAKTPTYVRLAKELKYGDRSLELSLAPTGWKVGDKLFIPDTRQIPFRKKNLPDGQIGQWEEAIISGINGKTITLQSSLKYDHLGFRNESGITEHFPHIANLTRNVVIRSENPAGTRGHVLLTERADIDIAYAWFKDLGRTRVDTLDSTAFDDIGNVSHIGTNQIGRYALHLHHLMGPVNSQNTGYQYTLVGNSIDSGLKWAIAIHNAHYGLVKQNTVHNFQGAGIMTEQGNESYNVIEQNFVGRVYSSRQKEAHDRGGIIAPNGNVSDTGFEGSAFWFRGPQNYVRDNVATDVSFSGYNYNGYYLKESSVPNFRGANTSDPNESKIYGSQKGIKENLKTLESARNEAYGYMIMGLWLTWHGNCCTVKTYVHESKFDDYLIWHMTHTGVESYHESRMTFNNFKIKNSKVATSQNEGGSRISRGFDFSIPSYENGDHVLNNFHIEGFNIGIDMPSKPETGNSAENSTEINNAYLKNYVNINEKMPARTKVSHIRNTKFEALSIPSVSNMPPKPQNIYMNPLADKNAIKIMLESKTYVYDYNQKKGDNFQVFFKEQAPNFIVPQNTDPGKGVPESGLTNTQAWNKYGRAIAGINPSYVCSTTRSEITGFVCPIR